MKKSFFALFLFSSLFSHAQRWYAINDSTSYSYENINITVGRHNVYLNQGGNLSVIRDFDINNPQINEDYIRDFDFIDADTWYVLVGSRYIGSETELYKTDDAGLNWQLLAPESFTVPNSLDGTANNINQVQFLNGRIYLFDAYYTSRVFYSDDLGQTWTHWFQCFWSHYYQIYACGSQLYIHGLAGDGFRPYMVEIPPSYFGQQNIVTTNVGGCNNSGTPGCYHAPANMSVPDVYDYFRNLFQTTICTTLDNANITVKEIKVYPNPAIYSLSLEGVDATIPFSISVYNSLGQKFLEDKNKRNIDLTSFESGVYFLKITQQKITKSIKVIKQ
ncbi:T9SS type A sorting domain-containing protein [Flavobacterium sp. AS60]|uniref:T9SS type A sorting domain-containing protein n=1 Tax=Flavobacterium anseongense TaxID=2910677 RepID=UPI001F359C7D|nr:T9SS type A sorting domain-containing protein [Flavobacterium sp. AS60]MCF6130113.1 T9SS type A sorting domain-containing protein [Flavobacterium sp. AS60]